MEFLNKKKLILALIVILMCIMSIAGFYFYKQDKWTLQNQPVKVNVYQNVKGPNFIVVTFGVKLPEIANAIYFDNSGAGRRHPTGWVCGKTAVLVFDRNNDGKINDGRELFGNYTVKYDGSGLCANAFEALRQEDTNNDGVLNKLDANWHNIKLWFQDKDKTFNQSTEIFSLANFKVDEIKLDKEPAWQETLSGKITAKAPVLAANGAVMGNIWQFFYNIDTFNREFTVRIKAPPYIKKLPFLQGSGAVRNLDEAFTWEANGNSVKPNENGEFLLDTPLQNIARTYTEAETQEERDALFEDFIYLWAKTSGLADMQERFGDKYKIVHKNIPDSEEVWNKKLYIWEAFKGKYYFDDEQHASITITQAENGGRPLMTIVWSESRLDSFLQSYGSITDPFKEFLGFYIQRVTFKAFS